MAPSGGRRSSGLNERQWLGLFSLGLVLFALILLRGKQAEAEGDQTFRNDALVVLVSPLVFGVALLCSGRSGPPRPTGTVATSAWAARRPRDPQLPRTLDQAAGAARRADASLTAVAPQLQAQLDQARAEAEEAQRTAQASQRQLEAASGATETARARIAELQSQLLQA